MGIEGFRQKQPVQLKLGIVVLERSACKGTFADFFHPAEKEKLAKWRVALVLEQG